MNAKDEAWRGYCIYVETVCEGECPVEYNGQGTPFVYSTIEAAQRAIAEYTIERLQQFLVGERDFDDAMTVEEYVVDVHVQSDGSVCDESGQRFGRTDS
jgi:hypothetical protein